MVKEMRKLNTPIALLVCLCVAVVSLFFTVPSRSHRNLHDALYFQQGLVIPQAGNTNETFPFEKTTAAILSTNLHLYQRCGRITAPSRDLTISLFTHSIFYTCIAINAP
jgi:hypothetical protein